MTNPDSQLSQGLPLEAPQPLEKPKGLVPRSALAIILGVGFALLVLYAFYDVNIRRKQQNKAMTHAAALAIGDAPPLKELREIRAQQEGASAPTAATTSQAGASGPQRAVAAMQPLVPAAVMATAGVPAHTADAPRSKQLSEDQERRMAETRAKAEAAEAEHLARMLMSPMVRLENKEDRSANQGTDSMAAHLAKTVAAAQGVTSDDTQRLAEQERDQVLRAIGQAQAASVRKSTAQRDSEWVREASASGVPAPLTSVAPASKIMLVQSTMIPAVTLTAINSDLPGTISAKVSEDVKDSLTQRHVLVPKGSRLIGRYSADISPGQERVLMAFSRLILPDGHSVDLVGSMGVDSQGQSGLGGEVNNHWFKIFGHSLAIAMIADKAMPDKGVKQSSTLTSSTATRTVAGEVVADVAKRVLDRNTHIPPTLTAPMGQRIFVSITSDLPLTPWHGRDNYVR